MKIETNSLVNITGPTGKTDLSKEGKLKKSCQDFEALLLKQMLTTMRKSIPKSELFNTNNANEIYQSMYDDELAKAMAHGKGMGISELLYSQLSGQLHQAPTYKQFEQPVKQENEGAS